MTRTRPTLDELRHALADFEATADRDAPSYEFYRRVADNVAALIAREAAQADAADAAAQTSLQALLGQTGALAELNRELARRIRGGEIDHANANLLRHLRKTTRASLAIDNPRYASYRRDTGGSGGGA